VIVVGHQPTLGAVASLLLTGQVQALSVKKGAVWWLRSRDREGEGQVVLVAALTPEQV
jgi:phosphohistidine phosphatase